MTTQRMQNSLFKGLSRSIFTWRQYRAQFQSLIKRSKLLIIPLLLHKVVCYLYVVAALAQSTCVWCNIIQFSLGTTLTLPLDHLVDTFKTFIVL